MAADSVPQGRFFRPARVRYTGSGASRWGGFRLNADIVRSLATWNFADRLDYHGRAVNFFYFAVGMPRRFAGASGATLYLMSPTDTRGTVVTLFIGPSRWRPMTASADAAPSAADGAEAAPA